MPARRQIIRLPRVEAVLGGRLDEQLRATNLLALVERGEREAEDLDFKLEPYGRGDSEEIGKDVAAMTNLENSSGLEKLKRTAEYWR
jgi:hypothetical protein